MKTIIKSIIFVLLPGINIICHAQTTSVPPPTPYRIIHRQANERTWQRTLYRISSSGKLISQTHSYKEVASGLCYRQNGQWLDSVEQVNILPDGTAAATNGQHQAYFPIDIYSGAVTLVTPDGTKLQSRPVGLCYDDGTNTVLLAALTNAVGQLVHNQALVNQAGDIQSISGELTGANKLIMQGYISEGYSVPTAASMTPAAAARASAGFGAHSFDPATGILTSTKLP